MPLHKRRMERLTALLIIGMLALNFPMFTVFHREMTWFGLPAIYCYISAVWGAFIVLVAIIMERT